MPIFFGKESESSRKNNKPAVYAERQQQESVFHTLYIGVKQEISGALTLSMVDEEEELAAAKVRYDELNRQSEAQNHAIDEVDVGFSQKLIRSVKDKDVNGAMATKKTK